MSAVRWARTEYDASEVLTLVRLDDSGDLAIQITAGPAEGDDFVGLYDLDGDQIQLANRAWTVVGEGDVPAEQIAEIGDTWESGTSVVARIVEVPS